MDSVDSRISVHRIRAWNPFQLTKKLFKKHIPPQGFSLNTEGQKGVNLLTRLSSNLFIPDPRKTWNNQAVKKALEIVDSYGIDTIITTSPPHSVQLIGKRVAQQEQREVGRRFQGSVDGHILLSSSWVILWSLERSIAVSSDVSWIRRMRSQR